VLLDGSLQSGRVGTDDLGDSVSVLEEQEGRHGSDAKFLGDVGDFIHVDLVEFGARELLAVLLDDGGDGLARAAPGGEAVNDNEVLCGAINDGCLEGCCVC